MIYKKISFLIMMCVLLGIITGCQKTKVGQNTLGEKTDFVTKLKVNATKEDLCRLVLKHDVFIDTASSNETKSVIMTMLSDGSDVRVLVDWDSLAAWHRHFGGGGIGDFLLTADMSSLIYTVDLIGLSKNVIDNVFIYDLKTGFRDSVFSESIKYEKNGYGLFVTQTKYNPTNDLLTISTNVCFRRFNMVQHSFIDLPLFGESFVDVGNNKFIYNRVHNDTVQCGIYDVRKKKSMLIRNNDTLKIGSASATGDGSTILLEKMIENDSVGKIGDSLFFYDSTLSIKNMSFVEYSDLCPYTMGYSGNWIYFEDSLAVRRIRAEDLINNQHTSYNDLITKSQVIYVLPYIIRDTYRKFVCQGIVLQVLPIKGEK